MKIRFLIIPFLISFVLLTGLVTAQPKNPKTVSDFTLMDHTNKKRNLSDYKNSSAIVLFFHSTTCSQATDYYGKMRKLAEKWGSAGVSFLGLGTNRFDSIGELAYAVEAFKVPFPFLRDEGGVIAGKLNVTLLPEVIVLDKKLNIIYRGLIDAPDPIRKDALLEYLDEVLKQQTAKKKITIKSTPVTGCKVSQY